MPKQKDLKRLVRSRMQKTGESYTAARAQLTRRNTSTNAARGTPRDLAKIAGMSDDAVRSKTGRTWAEWTRALDVAEAEAWSHAQIARHLYDVCKVDRWWSQMVAVGYERIRGLRERGQGRDGAYEFSKSRTYPVRVAALFAAASKPALRRRWLPGVALVVRKASPNKSLRITWPDGTNVDVYFFDKGAKSSISVQHQKLKSRKSVDELKIWWGGRFDALAEVLGG
jgi:hypothetical protein